MKDGNLRTQVGKRRETKEKVKLCCAQREQKAEREERREERRDGCEQEKRLGNTEGLVSRKKFQVTGARRMT